MNDLASTLAAFAGPVLQPLPQDTPLTRRREALGLAVLVWNAAILDRNGGDHVPMLVEQLACLPEPGRTILTQIAEELLARKKEQYAADVRIIVRWELTEVAPGQLSLEVEGATAA